MRFAVLQEPTNTWWQPENCFGGREHRRKEHPKSSKQEGVRVSKSIALIFVGPRCFIFLLAIIAANSFNKDMLNVVSSSLHMFHADILLYIFYFTGREGGL
jgi:hypothetical protein